MRPTNRSLRGLHETLDQPSQQRVPLLRCLGGGAAHVRDIFHLHLGLDLGLGLGLELRLELGSGYLCSGNKLMHDRNQLLEVELRLAENAAEWKA